MAKKFKLTQEGRQLAKEYKEFCRLREKFVVGFPMIKTTSFYKMANLCFYIEYKLDSVANMDYENLIKSGEWAEKALECYIIINK